MSQFFNARSSLRIIATAAFSIFSYAAMAQSAPSIETCGQALSSFQKRLYAHFLAGPESLRSFIFNERGIHLLDVREVDAWARHLDAATCPAREVAAPTADDNRGAPMPASTSVPGSAIPIAAGEPSSDGCTTNVLDVMHCTAHSERTREAVIAELRNARAAGELATIGEMSDARVSDVVPRNAAVAMTRPAVKQELALARQAHQLQFGER